MPVSLRFFSFFRTESGRKTLHTIYHILFVSEIDQVMKNHHLHKQFTQRGLLDEFDIIKRLQSPSKKPRIDEITKKQRDLYKLFWVDADSLV